ncbi:thermonuclease family protein [Microvirga roseola]|uniref:thermonuclease family protein n=1 Tax=Microvirga roseola TaxID=2883126 RepID=UPI001E388844|nr:hypothetical protein [Microvirga roseola]
MDEQAYRSSAPEGGSSRTWSQMREEVRAVIRQEVDRLNPTADARRPLELIIESSLRYSLVDGTLRITVIDPKGRPRMIDKDGRSIEFTIRDLLDELRESHPVLFQQSRALSPEPAAEAPPPLENPIVHERPVAAPPPPQPEKPRRDWLNVDSGEASREAASAGLFGGETLRDFFASRQASPATGDAARFHAARDGFPISGHRARSFVDGLRERSLPRGRGFAIGALLVAALLGLGTYSLFDSEPEPPVAVAADSDGPEATGTITPTTQAVADVAPAAAPSRPRSLKGVPEVLDTATLSLEGEVVRLFGVEWAPGAGKPEDMASYLGGREVSCEPAGGNDTYRCEVDGRDLSRVVLFNGGGKPTDEATPELKAAAEQARQSKIGVWSPQ